MERAIAIPHRITEERLLTEEVSLILDVLFDNFKYEDKLESYNFT